MNATATASKNSWPEIKHALNTLTLSHSLQIISGSNAEIKRHQLEKIARILQSQFSLLLNDEGSSIQVTGLIQLLKSKTLLSAKKLTKLKNLLESNSHSNPDLLLAKNTIIQLSEKIKSQYDSIVFSNREKKQLTSIERAILVENFGSGICYYYSDFISDPLIG